MRRIAMLCVRAGRARRGARRWGSRLRLVVIVRLEPPGRGVLWLLARYSIQEEEKGEGAKGSLSLSLSGGFR